VRVSATDAVALQAGACAAAAACTTVTSVPRRMGRAHQHDSRDGKATRVVGEGRGDGGIRTDGRFSACARVGLER